MQRARKEQARRSRRRAAIWGGSAAAVVAITLGVTVPLATAASGPPAGAPMGTATPSGTGPASTSGLPLAPLGTLGPLRGAPAPGGDGSEGVPVPSAPPLASTASAATGQTVDGISCNVGEQLVYHIHAHLTIFAGGQARQVPYGIGIPGAQPTQTPNGPFVQTGTCFYWLHTHAPDGIIHIESPAAKTYTLGDFFDEWRQPLSSGQAGPDKGHVTALYNGRVWTGNPRDIPLTKHAQIQLEVGRPLVAPEQIPFPNGL